MEIASAEKLFDQCNILFNISVEYFCDKNLRSGGMWMGWNWEFLKVFVKVTTIENFAANDRRLIYFSRWRCGY